MSSSEQIDDIYDRCTSLSIESSESREFNIFIYEMNY